MEYNSCFKNLVGFRDNCSDYLLSKSGLYIDDFQEFSIETLSDISVLNSGRELFLKIYDTSVREMLLELEDTIDQELQLQLNSSITDETIGYAASGYHSPENKNRGIRIKKRTDAQIHKIAIDRIGLICDTTGTVTITIHDGNISSSHTIDCIAGQAAMIEINYICNNNEVFILTSNATIGTQKSTVASSDLIVFPCCGGCNYTRNKYLDISGWNGTNVDNYTFGMYANIRMFCDKQSVLCGLSADLSLALLYKIASKLSQTAMRSGRINPNTNAEYWEQFGSYCLEEYEKYKKINVRASLDLLKKVDPLCITCRGNKIVNTRF